jgi:uncharacterized protein (DUF433 family)
MTLPDFLTRGPKGEIRLTGHRIDLYLIVLLHDEGHTSEMLHNEYPTLPLDLIDKVLAFYFENKAEMDAYVADVESKIEQHRANYQPGPGILRMRKLMEERAQAEQCF